MSLSPVSPFAIRMETGRSVAHAAARLAVALSACLFLAAVGNPRAEPGTGAGGPQLAAEAGDHQAPPSRPGAGDHQAPPSQAEAADHQPARHDTPQHEGQGHDGGSHEATSPWALIGKLFNFAVLAGALIYLLRSPFAAYLAARATAIRADLANAEDTRVAAARQLEEIQARMKALPGEIAALTERGKRDIAAEEARIREAADAERQRMLEQARHEIDLQVKAAERMLRRRAGELAVEVAGERVRRTITPADHDRLVAQYLENVGGKELTL